MINAGHDQAGPAAIACLACAGAASLDAAALWTSLPVHDLHPVYVLSQRQAKYARDIRAFTSFTWPNRFRFRFRLRFRFKMSFKFRFTSRFQFSFRFRLSFRFRFTSRFRFSFRFIFRLSFRFRLSFGFRFRFRFRFRYRFTWSVLLHYNRN